MANKRIKMTGETSAESTWYGRGVDAALRIFEGRAASCLPFLHKLAMLAGVAVDDVRPHFKIDRATEKAPAGDASKVVVRFDETDRESTADAWLMSSVTGYGDVLDALLKSMVVASFRGHYGVTKSKDGIEKPRQPGFSAEGTRDVMRKLGYVAEGKLANAKPGPKLAEAFEAIERSMIATFGEWPVGVQLAPPTRKGPQKATVRILIAEAGFDSSIQVDASKVDVLVKYINTGDVVATITRDPRDDAESGERIPEPDYSGLLDETDETETESRKVA